MLNHYFLFMDSQGFIIHCIAKRIHWWFDLVSDGFFRKRRWTYPVTDWQSSYSYNVIIDKLVFFCYPFSAKDCAEFLQLVSCPNRRSMLQRKHEKHRTTDTFHSVPRPSMVSKRDEYLPREFWMTGSIRYALNRTFPFCRTLESVF